MEKTRKNLAAGINRVKWIASFLAERTRAESTIAKLLYDRSRVEDKINDLYRDIGRRVMELRDSGGQDVFDDPVVQQALIDLENMKESAEEYKKKAEKINKLPEE